MKADIARLGSEMERLNTGVEAILKLLSEHRPPQTQAAQLGTPGHATQLGTHAPQLGTPGTQLGTHAPQLGTNATQLGTQLEATQLGTQATQLGTQATRLGTHATQLRLGTQAAQLGTTEPIPTAPATEEAGLEGVSMDCSESPRGSEGRAESSGTGPDSDTAGAVQVGGDHAMIKFALA